MEGITKLHFVTRRPSSSIHGQPPSRRLHVWPARPFQILDFFYCYSVRDRPDTSPLMLGPRGMDPRSAGSMPLQRQGSTKQLISRYESMSPGPSSRPPSHVATTSSTPLKVPAEALPSDLQKKEKSPIRQSFRNLLSVFKKANVRKGKQDQERPLSSFRKQHPLVVDNPPSFDAPPVLRSRSRKLTSSLLYLSRTPQLPSDCQIFPVWTSCKATLESDSIVISCLTAHGNPSIHTIQLSNCTDVRSLSMQQLNPEEIALLPKREETNELKVFEILFEGRPREKFAANSVQERAGWVSAVWDIVLPCQEPQRSQAAEITKDVLENPDPMPTSVTTVSSAPSHSERSLPPIPVNTKPHALLLDTHMLIVHSRTGSFTPISPSIYPPTRPVSRTSSGVDSRSTSPSIANLSQMSVVRQRLAKIEPNSSQSSHGGLTSPTSSKASCSTRLTTPVLHSTKGPLNSPIESQDMLRIYSERSSAADSILDSYGDAPARKLMAPIPVSLAQSVPEATTVKESLELPYSTTGRNRHQSSLMYPGLEPVVELLHDQSAKNYDQTANLGDQVLSLQNDIHRLPREIASAIGMDVHSKTVLKMVAKLEEQARSNEEAIGNMNKSLKEHWTKHESKASCENASLAQELQSIRRDISQDLSYIRSRLDLPSRGRAVSPIPTKLNNVVASNAVASATAPTVDLSGSHAKLDNLLAASSSASSSESGKDTLRAGASKIEDTLTKVVALLQNDISQQALQAQQQADSVRYLNELNSWLEAFVNNGTSQIHDLSTGVDQLCRDLGSVEGGSTLMADVRQLSLGMVEQDRSSTALQASVDGLYAILNEHFASSNVASIAALIDRQRQDHEGLLRALTTEISSEIKGERLRFVEAMKEATAINVQIHVEQFKKELKREVIEMTEEVGRLHHDRQAMQNQIADLFAFYNKQKAAAEVDQSPPPTCPRREPTGFTGRRPLPQPRRQ